MEKKIKLHDPSVVVVIIFQVLFEIFSLPQILKTIQLSTGKKCAKCNALNSSIKCVNAFAVIFADPQWEGYKFHSLLGSVGKLSAETNFNFPTQLPSITSLESAKI